MLDTPYRIIGGRIYVPRQVTADARFGRISESRSATTARAGLDRRY